MPTDQPQPAFVLVRPQMGENIGAAARAMWNFTLDRMRIVAPRDGWPNEKAVVMASGAGRLLDEAQIYGTVPEALQDCTYVLATPARPRGLTKPVLSPERAMQVAAEKIAAGRSGKRRDRPRQCHYLGAGEPRLCLAEPWPVRSAGGLRVDAAGGRGHP